MVSSQLNHILTGQEKKINNRIRRIDCYLYSKLPSPKHEEMTFDAMLKRAENKKNLGSEDSIYAKLNRLRKLRNRIHLQEIKYLLDTDWNALGPDDLRTMKSVLHAVFTGTTFHPTQEERAYFSYLTTGETI